MINKNNHCCELMTQFLEDRAVGIDYYPICREYTIDIRSSLIKQGIDYCPWCGTRLPESLRKKYDDILKDEYGVDDDWDEEQASRIPKEFKSDEWWKKRGL